MGKNPRAEDFKKSITKLCHYLGAAMLMIGLLFMILAVTAHLGEIPHPNVWEILFYFFFGFGGLLIPLPMYVDWWAKQMDPVETRQKEHQSIDEEKPRTDHAENSEDTTDHRLYTEGVRDSAHYKSEQEQSEISADDLEHEKS